MGCVKEDKFRLIGASCLLSFILVLELIQDVGGENTEDRHEYLMEYMSRKTHRLEALIPCWVSLSCLDSN